MDETTRQSTAARCDDAGRYGGLALDGSLSLQGTAEIAEHLLSCESCANYIDQVAKTRALVGLRGRTNRPPGAPEPPGAVADDPGDAPLDPDGDDGLVRAQAWLMTMARAIDPAHADELVQSAWTHVLADHQDTRRDRARLASLLVRRAREHARADDARDQAWAAGLLRHHPHNAADLAEADVPDPGGHPDWRTLADLDALDPDGESAELYLPDLYGDGPDQGEWSAPPTAWPAVANILGPEQEAETEELYSVLDDALAELTSDAADAVYLVDIEGHSPETAASLLGRRPGDLQRDLLEARDHVRRRLDEYLTAG